MTFTPFSLVLLSPGFARRHSRNPAELLRKIELIAVSQLISNLLDRQRGVAQQILCPGDTALQTVAHRGDSQPFLKQAVQSGDADPQAGGNLLNRCFTVQRTFMIFLLY